MEAGPEYIMYWGEASVCRDSVCRDSDGSGMYALGEIGRGQHEGEGPSMGSGQHEGEWPSMGRGQHEGEGPSMERVTA